MDEFTIRPLRDAHETLSMALAIKPADDIVRDAVIQRFEYTFELAWKNLKRVLEEEYGRRELTIRDMFREGAALGLLRTPRIGSSFIAKLSTFETHPAEQTARSTRKGTGRKSASKR